MKLLSLLGGLCLTASALLAQDYTGHIRDAKTQQGIPYVNIGIPSKAFGFISDDEGAYTFRVTNEKDTDTMQISCIGYQSIALSVLQFKTMSESQHGIRLNPAVYELATTTVRPNEYKTEVMGLDNVADLKCMNISGDATPDSATLAQYRAKGLNEKSIGVEIGNRVSIDKGQQTFIDRLQFKTCCGPNDTAIYRINIYTEGKTLEKHATPLGTLRVINTNNVMKQPVIVKTFGETKVHDIDLSQQNIEVFDDFIVALECIYSSKHEMNIGAKVNVFGKTDLFVRESIVDEWVKVPLVDVTFISATVTYKKKKGFFARLFD